MRLEKIPFERWSELKPIFEEFGVDELPDESSQVYALVEDEIIGIFLLEHVIHAGPFWVKPEYRNKGVGTLLAQHAIRLTEGAEVYVSALTPQTEGMCERLGLQKVQGSLWVK